MRSRGGNVRFCYVPGFVPVHGCDVGPPYSRNKTCGLPLSIDAGWCFDETSYASQPHSGNLQTKGERSYGVSEARSENWGTRRERCKGGEESAQQSACAE